MAKIIDPNYRGELKKMLDRARELAELPTPFDDDIVTLRNEFPDLFLKYHEMPMSLREALPHITVRDRVWRDTSIGDVPYRDGVER